VSFAVLGAGYWGKNHVREYSNAGIELTVCDLDKEKLGQYEKEFGVKTITDYKELLNDEKLLGLSICTPNPTHYKFAKEFLEAGKHVLLEKPMAVSSKEARELVEIARKKGVVLTVGHIFRFNNALKKLQEMIEAGELGKINVVELAWTNLDPVYPDRDILTDLALHSFDIINFLFGKNPENIQVAGEKHRRQDNEETVFITGKIDSAVVNLAISWVIPPKKREVIVAGSERTVYVNASTQEMKVIDMKTQEEESIGVEASNPLQEEIKAFIDSASNNKGAAVAAEKGAEIIEFIETVQEKLKEQA